MSNVLHLANGSTTACSSFRRNGGMVGFSLMDYHSALANPTAHVQPCKTCYPHYVRRLAKVNVKRAANGKAPLTARSL